MTSGTGYTPFRPAWWLPEGHSQTLWRKLTADEAIDHCRERLALKDGDFIDIDWCEKHLVQDDSVDRDTPIVVVIHGLCGCSSSPYVVALQNLLARNQIPSLAMNLRGCSGEVNRLARAYHSGVSEDLNEVFTQLSSNFPNRQFMFVGYSLGANVLLKWLGEIERNDQVAKAVAVSTPFQLDECSTAMLSGFSQLYGRYFVRKLTEDFQRKLNEFSIAGIVDQVEKLSSLGPLDSIKSLWEFDDQVTAPLHGFAGADDYYKRSSSAQYLQYIQTDTLLIQSSNDPLIPETAIPTANQLSPVMKLELSSKGGHVGFISGTESNWLEYRIKSHLIG